jgi:CubicO group peptidase (beta-lactamase class C family)
MKTAGEGGPYGMALLAAYAAQKNEGESLEQYLNDRVFSHAQKQTVAPDPADVAGFTAYINDFHRLLDVEKKAIERI